MDTGQREIMPWAPADLLVSIDVDRTAADRPELGRGETENLRKLALIEPDTRASLAPVEGDFAKSRRGQGLVLALGALHPLTSTPYRRDINPVRCTDAQMALSPCAMKHDGGWKRGRSTPVFESKWFKVRSDKVTLPTGEEIVYNVIEHPGFAMVVPLLADGRVMLERVFRYTIQETSIECPSGGLDGEAPEVAAHRELEEETGWLAGRMERLGTFYGSNGTSDEQFHVFLATELSETGRMNREPTEQIELIFPKFEEAVVMAARGEIPDAPTSLALLLADRRLAEKAGL